MAIAAPRQQPTLPGLRPVRRGAPVRRTPARRPRPKPGLVQVPLLGHLWALAACAAMADLLAPGTLWLGALGYVLVQTARALLVLGRARAARRRGRSVQRVRLGPLRMAVDVAP